MKIFALTVLMATTLGSVANAQSSHVSINAKAVASGGSVGQKQSSQGSSATDRQGQSYTRTQNSRLENRESSTSIEISAKNFGKEPEEVKIRWFFFTAKIASQGGGHIKDTSPEVISDYGEEVWNLASSETKKSVVSSKPVEMKVVSKVTSGYSSERNTRYIPTASRLVSGEKLKGWVIQLVSNDKVVQSVGSSTKYQAIGNDQTKLDSMIQKSETTAIAQ